MARHAIAVRERICLTCENPSPGPIKLLCYRWRPHGPFFPLLERLKTEENARLFVNGRVPVCTSCANYLQRQWNDYERKSISLPIEKRTYRLLSDERWERLNSKKRDEAASKADERNHDMPSYDENENPIEDEQTRYEIKPVPRKSKIPRLARPRGMQVSRNGLNSGLGTTPGISDSELLTDQELDIRVRTAASKIADRQKTKLLRRMAEMKFQEELDYVQKKVKKTMAMVHVKGREERIQEIEEELRKEVGDDFTERSETKVADEDVTKMIIPLVNNTNDDINELKEHILREMTTQRQELAKLRSSIKHEIALAMDDSNSRNDELWDFIIEMNERRRNGRHQRRNRPNSDGAHLYKPSRSKRIPKLERTSDGHGEKDSDDDFEYSDNR